VRGAVACQIVPRLGIIRDPLGDERAEPALRRRLAHRQMRTHHLGATVHGTLQPHRGNVLGRGPHRWRVECRRNQSRSGIAAAHGLPEGRVDPVEPARAGLDRPWLEKNMARMALRRNAVRLQRRLHRLVPRPRSRIVEPVPVNLPRAGFGDKRAQHVERSASPDHEVRTRPAQRGPERLGPEAETPFRRGPVALDHLVDDEDGNDRAARGRGAKRGVVRDAKIPPRPVQDRCLCHA
jgi:hypothetical protein